MKLKRSLPAKGTGSFLPDLEDEELTFSSGDSSEDEDLDRIINNEPDLNGSEDSDTSPEEVTFEAGKEASKMMRKRALEQMKQQDDILKKRRKEIHLRNTLQKKEKLKRLEEKFLPEEVLEEINDAPSVSKPSLSSSQPTRTIISEEPEDENEPSASVQTSNEYVYGKTKFQVKRLKDELLKPKDIPPEVANFKNQMMFRKDNKREKSTRSYFAKYEKKRAKGGGKV